MPKFKIRYTYTNEYEIEIDADDVDDAREQFEYGGADDIQYKMSNAEAHTLQNLKVLEVKQL